MSVISLSIEDTVRQKTVRPKQGVLVLHLSSLLGSNSTSISNIKQSQFICNLYYISFHRTFLSTWNPKVLMTNGSSISFTTNRLLIKTLRPIFVNFSLCSNRVRRKRKDGGRWPSGLLIR